MASDNYTTARALEAEGARIAFVSCEECGAALILDPDDEIDVLKLHDAWHRRMDLRDAE